MDKVVAYQHKSNIDRWLTKMLPETCKQTRFCHANHCGCRVIQIRKARSENNTTTRTHEEDQYGKDNKTKKEQKNSTCVADENMIIYRRGARGRQHCLLSEPGRIPEALSCLADEGSTATPHAYLCFVRTASPRSDVSSTIGGRTELRRVQKRRLRPL